MERIIIFVKNLSGAMKYILLFGFFVFGTSLFAQNTTGAPVGQSTEQQNENIPFYQAIEMLGFEKILSSKTESLMIKNNTPELVTRVHLRLAYKTPQNEMLDYREVVLDGEILPGMTKKFSFDSFDTNRQYYYYTTPPTGKAVESAYPFKVTATLLRYDIAVVPAR